MQTTSAVLSLFTRELELASVGRQGRALMETIQATGLDTLGASRPLQLGALLAGRDHRDELVGHYLGCAATDARLRTLAIVAAGPTIAEVVTRCSGTSPRPDFLSELSVVLLENLQVIHETRVTERRIWLAKDSVAKARAATRSPRGGHGASLESDYRGLADTLEAPEGNTHVKLEALDRVLASGAFTSEEIELVLSTRSTYGALEELARSLGISYAALQKRRRRIELRLEGAINAEVTK